LNFLGRYEATRLLGEGGMGRVFLATDRQLSRPVVVKVLHARIAADESFRERFEEEARLTAQFEHPHAVRVYDFGQDPTHGPCIVMEFVRGVTLAELLKKNRGRLNPARFYRLLSQLCDVLHVAHQQGIIHRDLTPANLMVVDPDTPNEKVKVMDFGLARVRFDSKEPKGQKELGGTPFYMSPEQARGDDIDHRSDLYSLGVILYQVLTGKLPFTGASAMEVMLAHVQDKPPGFAEHGDIGTVPWSVEDVVTLCLEKDPAKRPQDAQQLVQLYKAALFNVTSLPEVKAPKAEPEEREDPHDQITIDPNAVVYHMEAYLSSSIAEVKMYGFIRDVGGEIVESVPGMIRVRVGQPGTRYEMSAGAFSWLGMGRQAGMLELYLYMRQKSSKRSDLQAITVIMLSLKGYTKENELWLAQCNRIYTDVRGYLMGQDVTAAKR
jgi:serine/threonine-protein kinase